VVKITQKILEQAPQYTAPQYRLEGLGLTADELAAVKQQGHVAQEVRGRNRMVYKLRYRFGGRQRVRYLGADPEFAKAVREELQRIRRAEVMRKNLRSLTREGKRALRQSKLRLLPFVEQLGYAFHGFDLRRRQHADHVNVITKAKTYA
jgi:hypothetical protein